MREIKFRAWDKRNKKWFHPSLFILTTAGFYEDFREFDDGNALFDYEYELMQYTGVKSMGKKEIFEGDVVKGSYFENGNKHRFIGQVKFLGGCFKVVGINQYYGMHQELDSLYEPIGNVFENPELLEETK